MSLKFGWCIDGHCEICPGTAGDPPLVCACPHHTKTDLTPEPTPSTTEPQETK